MGQLVTERAVLEQQIAVFLDVVQVMRLEALAQAAFHHAAFVRRQTDADTRLDEGRDRLVVLVAERTMNADALDGFQSLGFHVRNSPRDGFGPLPLLMSSMAGAAVSAEPA